MTSRADEAGHQVAMHLRAAYAHLRRRSNLVFAAFGMTSDQYVVLTVLARLGEATQQQLMQGCYSDTATVGTMIALLERRRLVARAPHPDDRRAWRVALTETGRDLVSRMQRASTDLRVRVAGLFTPVELESLVEMLGRLVTALQPPARRATAGRGPQAAEPRARSRAAGRRRG